MCLRLFKGEAVQQPVQLAVADRHWLGGGRIGPLKDSFLQPAVIKPKPVVLPVQNLQLILFPIAENKQTWRKGIELESFLYDRSESINRFAQIGASTGEIYTVYFGRI